jgi:hypothetical protein
MYKIVNEELIKKIDNYLALMQYGEIIIIRHQDKITVDVKNRDRKFTIMIKDK